MNETGADDDSDLGKRDRLTAEDGNRAEHEKEMLKKLVQFNFCPTAVPRERHKAVLGLFGAAARGPCFSSDRINHVQGFVCVWCVCVRASFMTHISASLGIFNCPAKELG